MAKKRCVLNYSLFTRDLLILPTLRLLVSILKIVTSDKNPVLARENEEGCFQNTLEFITLKTKIVFSLHVDFFNQAK